MDEKIKNEWLDMIIDEEKELTTEELYSLIDPKNKKDYFDLVDKIVRYHSIKEGKPGEEDTLIFTQEYRRKFKATAIMYFIEHEKDNMQVELTLPHTIPIPIDPIQPNTAPRSLEAFYYTTSTANTK